MYMYLGNDYSPEHDPCVQGEAGSLGLWGPDCHWTVVRNRRRALSTGTRMSWVTTVAELCRWIADYPHSFRQMDRTLAATRTPGK